jgi:hypothetical protein
MREEGMKREIRFFAMAAVLAAVFLAGCGGGGGGGPATPTTQILSDQRADGDIAFAGGAYTVASAVTNRAVRFGFDNALTEFRAFMDFPLDGSSGQPVVPPGAAVLSAAVELFVNDVSFATSIPTLIDLIAYPTNGPTAPTDFLSPPLTATSFRTLNFFTSDIGQGVRIDVTPLVQEALVQGRRDVQLRFLYDVAAPASPGLVVIDDGSAATAPLLTVTWR